MAAAPRLAAALVALLFACHVVSATLMQASSASLARGSVSRAILTGEPYNYLILGTAPWTVVILDATTLEEVDAFPVYAFTDITIVEPTYFSLLRVVGNLLYACVEFVGMDNDEYLVADFPCVLYDLDILQVLQQDYVSPVQISRYNVYDLSVGWLLGAQTRNANAGLRFAFCDADDFMDQCYKLTTPVCAAGIPTGAHIFYSEITPSGFWRLWLSNIVGAETSMWAVDVNLSDAPSTVSCSVMNIPIYKPDEDPEAMRSTALIKGVGTDLFHMISRTNAQYTDIIKRDTTQLAGTTVSDENYLKVRASPNELFHALSIDPEKDVLFVGGEKTLYRIAINPTTFKSSRIYLNESVTDPFTHILVDTENDMLFTVHNKTGSPNNIVVQRAPTSYCQRFTTCSACQAAADPYCGWCPLQGACTTESACAAHDLPGGWSQDVCPAMTDFDSSSTQLTIGTTHTVSAQVSNVPDATSLGGYHCHLESTSLSIVVEADVSGVSATTFDIVCEFDITTATIEDFSEAATVHLRGGPTGPDFVAEATGVTVYNCGYHTDCPSCGGAGVAVCAWCTMAASCTPEPRCATASLAHGWQTDCPASVSASPSTVPIAGDLPVTLVFDKIPPSADVDAYYVEFVGDVTLRVPIDSASTDGTEETLTVTAPSFVTDGITPADAQSVSLRLIYDDGVNPPVTLFDQSTITVYDCGVHSLCEDCLESTYGCAPLVGSLTCSPLVSVGATPVVLACPLVNAFSPSQAPAGDVSTVFTVTGQYFFDPSGEGEYRCEFPLSAGTLSTLATYVGPTTLTCNAPSVVVSEAVGYIDSGRVAVSYATHGDSFEVPKDNVQLPNVRFFNCSTRTDCTSCLQLDQVLSAGTCGMCTTGGPQQCTYSSHCEPPSTFDASSCPAPAISSVSPTSGLISGGATISIAGADLGSDVTNIFSVIVAGVPCANFTWVSSQLVLCTTATATQGTSGPVTVALHSGESASSTVQYYFTYHADPTITGLRPIQAPRAAGLTITVTGTNFDRAQTITAHLGSVPVNFVVYNSTTATVTLPTYSDPDTNPFQNSTNVVLLLQADAATVPSSTLFQFRNNPVLTGVSITEMSASAKLSIVAYGSDLDVRPLQLFFGTSPCEVAFVNATAVVCTPTTLPANVLETLNASSSNSVDVPLSLKMDGFSATFSEATVTFFPDAYIAYFSPVNGTTEGGTSIHISGSNLVHGVPPLIRVAGVNCTITASSPSNVDCLTGPALGATSGPVEIISGDLRTVSTVNFTYVLPPPVPTFQPEPALKDWEIGLIAGAGALLLIIVIALLVAYRHRFKKTKKQSKQLMLELQHANNQTSTVLKEVVESYTEYHTRANKSGKVNAVFGSAKLTTFETFAVEVLFPKSDGVAPPRAMSLHMRPEDAANIAAFSSLLKDKAMALSLIRTLEANLKAPERKHVASLLVIALKNDIKYVTELLFAMLGEYIDNKVRAKSELILLRATDSITEKLLSAWLTFTLYPHVRDAVSPALYSLFVAVRSQIYRGAVDCITGSSQYTINAASILRQRITYDKGVRLTAVLQDREPVELEVNSCDAISQLKTRVLEAFGLPESASREYGLFNGATGERLLDIDASSEQESPNWIRINTVGYYKIAPNTEVRLMSQSSGPREREVPAGKEAYHLEKKAEGETTLAPTEIFYTRMMTMKESIQEELDDLFDAIFPVGQAPPPPIKRLFDFMDAKARELNITDANVTHIWKNNALALRFWVNLIANPQMVFSIEKPVPVHNSLSTVGQVLMDSCSTSENSVGAGAPASKLLYRSEVEHYKAIVKKYYADVTSAAPVTDADVHAYASVDADGTEQTLNASAAVWELINYTRKHRDVVTEATKDHPAAAQLQSVITADVAPDV